MKPRLALVGATGSVGEEIRRLIGERAFPVGELRLFGTADSAGVEVEFRDDELRIERVDPARVADCDLVWSAAPGALEPLLPALRESGARLVDVTGALELEPDVPLWLPGGEPVAAGARRVAVPRGIVTGLGMTLVPLAREVGLERVTALTLESASGAGRRGLDELSGQTVRVLNAMDGEPGESAVFPRALAFDCLPAVGELVECEDTSEEVRLRQVLRRLLGAGGLAVECTRVRVPIFVGALACVHVELAKELGVSRVLDLWRAAPVVRVLGDELPTPREAARSDDVVVGRIRAGEGPTALAFALALDTLRRGAALAAVEAAERLLES